MNRSMTMPFSRFHRLLLICLVPTLILSSPKHGAAATPKQERDECARNLQAIYEAVQAYRAKYQKMPDWLSDLIPDHLDNPNRLICPVTRRTGEILNYGLSDPKVSTSYVYEFCNHPIPDSIQGGSTLTMQEWKQLQMALTGSIVPMVRCHHHALVLNLSFDGKIYESPDSWESELSGIVRPEQLTPGYLADKFGGSPVNRFIAVALGPFFNCSLTENPHSPSGTDPGATLAMVPDGKQMFGGVGFDLRGIIHLQGRELKKMAPDRYPDRVQDIPVGLKTPGLYFLVGAGWAAADDTIVARFTVRYEDDETVVIPIRYDREVRDWIHGLVNGKDAPKPAWSGDIKPSPNEEQIVHLYKVSWDNPRPDVLIKSLDLESTMENTAVFIAGISARKN